MKFKLLAGSHVENGINYSARMKADGNPIVESERKLDEIYRGKFEQVDDHTPAAQSEGVTQAADENPVVGEAKITFAAKKREKGNRYDVVKLVGGTETGEKVNKRPLSEEQARELALQANQAGQ